jgi:hypothetical protein
MANKGEDSNSQSKASSSSGGQRDDATGAKSVSVRTCCGISVYTDALKLNGSVPICLGLSGNYKYKRQRGVGGGAVNRSNGAEAVRNQPQDTNAKKEEREDQAEDLKSTKKFYHFCLGFSEFEKDSHSGSLPRVRLGLNVMLLKAAAPPPQSDSVALTRRPSALKNQQERNKVAALPEEPRPSFVARVLRLDFQEKFWKASLAGFDAKLKRSAQALLYQMQVMPEKAAVFSRKWLRSLLPGSDGSGGGADDR